MASVSVSVVTAQERVLRHLERCGTCSQVLPVPPAPRVCTSCGMVKITPIHQEWPKSLKTFLILKHLARHFFHERLRPVQRSWELLLVGNYEGGRFPNGQIIKQGVNPDDVFAMAVKEAEEWRLAGSKTDFL